MSDSSPPDLLPFLPAHELAPSPKESRWLVRDLWADQAVGIVGGEPKCCKSFLALDLAVAVASGLPALRSFPVDHPGRVLLFAAEDSHDILRRRLEGIAAVVGTTLDRLDLQVITAPTLRIDLDADEKRLEQTIAHLAPRLLVLDPFVRLHRIDENASAEVAPLLAFLRSLQRVHGLAVLLVHHSKKAASHLRAGQALRGSSELHAWGDSNLYLRRRDDELLLSVEHRAAPPRVDLPLALREHERGLALELVDSADRPEPRNHDASPAQRIQQALAEADAPLSAARLRELCRLRSATLCATLADLTAAGHLRKTPGGYSLANR